MKVPACQGRPPKDSTRGKSDFGNGRMEVEKSSERVTPEGKIGRTVSKNRGLGKGVAPLLKNHGRDKEPVKWLHKEKGEKAV